MSAYCGYVEACVVLRLGSYVHLALCLSQISNHIQMWVEFIWKKSFIPFRLKSGINQTRQNI